MVVVSRLKWPAEITSVELVVERLVCQPITEHISDVILGEPIIQCTKDEKFSNGICHSDGGCQRLPTTYFAGYRCNGFRIQ